MSTATTEAPVTTVPVADPPATLPAGSVAETPHSAADTAAAAAAQPIVTPPVTPPAEPVYALALPKDAVIEAGALERLTTFAKAEKLSPEVAQKALELANAEVAADRTRQSEANAEAFKTMAFETWMTELKADKEFGGEKFDATVLESSRAVAKFITPEEKQILNDTGWGNHPMLVRFFARVGRTMAPDTLVNGNAGGVTQPKTDAQVIYPGMNP